MADLAPVDSVDERFDPELEYRSVDSWAVAGLILGLLSPCGMLAPLLSLLPPLGVLTNAVALRRLSRDSSRSGRGAALVGLMVSIVFLAYPLSRPIADRLILGHQPVPLADQFFADLQSGHPERAFNLSALPDRRQIVDDDLWTYYRLDLDAQRNLRQLVEQPPVHALLVLGERAKVRLFRTGATASDGNRALVQLIYTVTYRDELDDKKKTFLLGVLMERKPTEDPLINPWRVVRVEMLPPDAL